MDVNRDVHLVVPQLCRSRRVDSSVQLGYELRSDGDLPKPREVVESGEQDDEDNVESGPAISAEGPGLERMADGDEPLQSNCQSEVDGDRLGDEGQGVHDRGQQRVHADVIPHQEGGVGVPVQRRQAEQ